MSLLSLHDQKRQLVNNSSNSLASMAMHRDANNEALKTQHKQQQAAGVGSAVGLGISAGMAFGGPVGMAVGGTLALLTLF